MSVRIIVGDALERLGDLPDGSVHCVVTSPPYWGLRSYEGGPGLIGLESTFAEHVSRLVEVFQEVRRVLRRDGTCWLNYGEAWAGSWGAQSRGSSPRETHTGSLKGAPPGCKPKDLMFTAIRLAIALQEDGWWVRDKIIWHKPNPKTESARDRPTRAYEEVFLMPRSPRYFYDAEAVATPAEDWHGGKFNRNGHPRHHYERRTVPPEERRPTANLRDVWTIPTYPFRGDHYATFPPKLVELCILPGTSAHGCCSECGAPWRRRGESRDWRVVGDAVKLAREEMGLSRVELASLVGVGDNNIWDWEEGGHVPTGERWEKLSSALSLGLSRADFMERPAHILTGAQDTERQKRAEGTAFKHRALRVSADMGWVASCRCDAAIVPCTVLDPFAGSGTTGLVADRLGRDAILIEISEKYADMARRRIEDDAPLFADVE